MAFHPAQHNSMDGANMAYLVFGFGSLWKEGNTLEPVQKSRALGDLLLFWSGLMEPSFVMHILYIFDIQHNTTRYLYGYILGSEARH